MLTSENKALVFDYKDLLEKFRLQEEALTIARLEAAKAQHVSQMEREQMMFTVSQMNSVSGMEIEELQREAEQ